VSACCAYGSDVLLGWTSFSPELVIESEDRLFGQASLAKERIISNTFWRTQY